MVRIIPAQFVRKCMLFSSCATLRKRFRIIYSYIHFFYLLFTITVHNGIINPTCKTFTS